MIENLKEKKIYIIILNYISWSDTIECLESVLRNNYSNYQVIVVDNNSPNNSIQYIKDWVEGKLNVWVNPENPLRELSFPSLRKPIPYIFYKKGEAEKGGILELEKNMEEKIKNEKNNLNITSEYPLILIQAEENRGYSAGNNIGIRYALVKNDFEYIWILNNDTVIQKDTLLSLIDCAEKKDKNYGIFGTALLYYDKPKFIQALGGKFNKYFAAGKHKYANKKFSEIKFNDVQNFDYIIGASMLLTKEFLKKVGLLAEDYFLYYEEIDLSFRAKKEGFKMFICVDSIVFHKEGATIDKEIAKSNIADFYAIRNRKVLIKKHYPLFLPFVYGGYLIAIFNRLKRKEYKKAYNVIKIMFGKSEL